MNYIQDNIIQYIENIRKSNPQQYKELMKLQEKFTEEQMQHKLNSLSNKEKLRSKLSELSSKRNTKHKDAFTEVKKEEFLKKEKEREEALKEKKRLQNRRKRQNRKERERNNKKNKEVESEFLELKEKNVSNE